ncbi:hypothetical protein [Oceanirhabdus seepicola]|uniref:Uncharacterized protein n=1 Tax=Oceanirhabdus seepicola TaxID=2828781 RepID=A0A9J6P0W2_9CLOT|nr:hypothetical protein [Oceanirhabdus seepicola]MCM1989745.1 hypothetical protein [Oceanirhabdus seepicola]
MKKTSVGNIVWGWIFPILSYILFFMSIYLIKLVDDRMGLQRDLFVRNKKLFTSVLSPELVIIYKIILIIGTLISIYYMFKVNRQNKSTMFGSKTYSFKAYYYGIFSSAVSIAAFAMLFSLEKVDTLAFPWIVISLLIAAIVQYIRIIQYMITNKR